MSGQPDGRPTVLWPEHRTGHRPTQFLTLQLPCLDLGQVSSPCVALTAPRGQMELLMSACSHKENQMR